ncbi:hypothetical protein RUND412_003178 [Rhizina undulata]
MSGVIQAPDREREDEPLLGPPGGVSQREDQSLAVNLVLGTALLAQTGALLLAGLVFGAVFSNELIVFSLHPILNSLAIVIAVQAILVLQPTHTPDQKRKGTYIHASLVGIVAVAFYTALGVVIWNKNQNGYDHFESPHAILGLVIYILVAFQAFVGFTQFFVPSVYGGVDNAKSIYKYHRVSGYVILLLLLLNVVLATYTYYGAEVLHLNACGTTLAGVLVVIGVYPRIKKQKVKLF